MITVLLLEDDQHYADFFIKYMIKKDINVLHVKELDINQINLQIKKNPNLIIMDFFFGEDNSLNIYSYLKNKNIPIMYLTSNNNEEIEASLLKQGVYDYIDKFKSLQIIETKIKKQSNNNNKEYYFYQNTLNIESKTINNQCQLTNNEYKIMVCLIKAIPHFVSTEEIISELWDGNIFIEKNTLVVAIKRLREKLKTNKINVYIDVEKGKGYKLNEINSIY